jgi:polyhydroxyalkanoate synthesis regulator phasin
VTGTEKAIENLSGQFSSLANSFQSQMQGIAAKIDGQQAAYAASKNTNWPALIGAGATALTVIGGFFFSQMQPINNDISRHEREITHIAVTAASKDDLRAFKETEDDWNKSLRDRLRADEDGAVSQRQIKEVTERLDEHNRITEQGADARIDALSRRVEAIDSTIVKRPEIAALLENETSRIDALVARITEMQRQVSEVLLLPRKP